MTFFETFLLLSYSLKLNKISHNGFRIMTGCECYDNYRPESKFFTTVIRNRLSYMACLKYETAKRFNYEHCCIPILIGSWLDYLIRGAKCVREARGQWGQVILRGIPELYMSFSTFDALSMHARLSNGQLSIEWFFYVNNEGVALSYNN